MTPLGVCFPDIQNDLIQLRELACGYSSAARYTDEQFNMMLGHAKATTTGKYGNEPEGIPSERVKMIEAVAFPGLS